MVKRVIWANAAVEDRDAILDYWFRRIGTKTYSKKLDRIFKDAVRMLRRFPQLGKKVDGRIERALVKDNFIIYYLVTEDALEVRRIWDSRRNPETLEL